jgi:N-succinyldiaminopimelate aminotransferase
VPRFPSLSSPAQALPSSIFEQLMRRVAAYHGEVIPLHIGDTHLAPPDQSRLGSLGFPTGPSPDLYRYSPPPGKQELLDAVVAKLAARNRFAEADCNHVQITAGATHALSCAVRSVLDTGDQLLVLAPYWPLIRGIAVANGVRPVDVPFSHDLLRGQGIPADQLIEEYVTPHTAGLYLCTPNNPDGKVLTPEELAAIARVAERHDLWILADEVYEDVLYDGRQHHSIGSLPGMGERTVTVFSFSKSYGQAGLRVGYVVAPRSAAAAVRKMSNHSVYCVPKAMQKAALAALEHGAGFLAEARRDYAEARELAHGRLADLCVRPEGATYLWLDLDRFRRPGEEDALALLTRMADAGVLLAPGAVFGHAFRSWARLCFTSVARPTLEEGLDRLRRVLDE